MAGRRGRRRRGRNDELLQGVLLVDKPAGKTSREVCEFVKHRLRLGKVGHGGTLDPFATGLLPLLLNGATRLMPYLQNQDKVYEATVRFGVRTDTMDPTGEVVDQQDATALDHDAVREAVGRFLGDQVQTIPRYSAARVDGKRLYEYAREGEEVELPTKEIRIESIDIGEFVVGDGVVDLSLRIHCSAGTYVRALADDIGQAVGVGAHLAILRRLAAGTLGVEGAVTLDAIGDRAASWREQREARQDAEGAKVRFEPVENTERWTEFLGAALVAVPDLLGLPTLTLPGELAERVRGGQPLRKAELDRLPQPLPAFRVGDQLVLLDRGGARAVAVVRASASAESLDRREPGAVVLTVERVLR